MAPPIPTSATANSPAGQVPSMNIMMRSAGGKKKATRAGKRPQYAHARKEVHSHTSTPTASPMNIKALDTKTPRSLALQLNRNTPPWQGWRTHHFPQPRILNRHSEQLASLVATEQSPRGQRVGASIFTPTTALIARFASVRPFRRHLGGPSWFLSSRNLGCSAA